MRTPTCITSIWFVMAALSIGFRPGGAVGAEAVTDGLSLTCAAVTLLEGASTVTLSSSAPRSLTSGETLYAGSVLQTGSASRLELIFADGSIVRLNEASSVELGEGTKFSEKSEPEKSARRVQVVLLKGEIWTNLSDPSGGNALEIRMAHALLTGIGSVFRAVMFPDGAVEIKGYTGEVTASGPFESAGGTDSNALQFDPDDDTGVMEPTASGPIEPWRHQIEPYRKVIVQASGAASSPFRFAARTDTTDWVRWNQQRDAAVK